MPSIFAVFNSFGLYVFWGFVGLAIMAPLFFMRSLFEFAKTADRYHFRGYYKLEKEHHYRSVRTYGSLALICSVIVVGFFVIL